jgi:uncharacterized membrane protein
MLSDFPLALLLVAPLWDGVALVQGGALFWAVSFWTQAAGLAFGALAATAGLIDYASIPESERGAMTTANRHMTVMIAAIGAYVASVALRAGAAPPNGARLFGALSCEGVGAAALMVGGWLGGELVFGHGIGVRRPRGSEKT